MINKPIKMGKAFDEEITENEMQRPIHIYMKIYSNRIVEKIQNKFFRRWKFSLQLTKFLTSHEAMKYENKSTHAVLTGVTFNDSGIAFWQTSFDQPILPLGIYFKNKNKI